MLLPPTECPLSDLWVTFENDRSAHFYLRARTHPPANWPKDLRGYWTKVHEIFSRGSFVIDGVNATVRVAIRCRMTGAKIKK